MPSTAMGEIGPPLVYEREEVATLARVSVFTIDRLIKSGKLHAVRLGRRVVIPAGAVAALLRGE